MADQGIVTMLTLQPGLHHVKRMQQQYSGATRSATSHKMGPA